MPYRRIEHDDGSSSTVWEAGSAGQVGARHGANLYAEDEPHSTEAPTPPEPESVINERIRLQSGSVNGCITFGCLFALMALAITICGALYFLPYL